MKIRDVYPLFTNANEIKVAYGSALSNADLSDPVVMEAYGDFKIQEVRLYPLEDASRMVNVELHLELRPVREVAR